MLISKNVHIILMHFVLILLYVHFFIAKKRTKNARSAKALRVPDRPRAMLLIGSRFHL